MTSLRIFVSYALADAAFAQRLIADLHHAGAEVVTDDDRVPDEAFMPFLNQHLSCCQWLVVVQTADALRSLRVQTAVTAALNLVNQGQMKGVLRVIAVAASTNESQEEPPMWATSCVVDASQDYPRARDKMLLQLGLIEIDNKPRDPLSIGHTPSPLPPSTTDHPRSTPVDKLAHPAAPTEHTKKNDIAVSTPTFGLSSLAPLLVILICILVIVGIAAIISHPVPSQHKLSSNFLAVGNPAMCAVDAGSTQCLLIQGKDNHIYKFSLPTGAKTWQYIDLTSATMAPLAASDPVEYTTMDGNSQVEHIVYQDVDGHIDELFLPTNSNVWQYMDLLNAVSDVPLAIGDPAVCTTTNGNNTVEHVVYHDTANHIHELFLASGSTTWNHLDLTNASNPSNIVLTSLTASDLAVYTVGSDEHIVYRGMDNNIYELYPKSNRWVNHSITSSANAPVAAGNPVGYLTTDGGVTEHVVYRGEDGRIYELFYGVGTTDTWHYNDLITFTTAPLAASDLAVWIMNDGGKETSYLVYHDTGGDVYELSYAFSDGNGWMEHDLTFLAGFPPPTMSRAVIYTDTNNIEYVVSRSMDGNIYEISDPSGKWRYFNILQSVRG